MTEKQRSGIQNAIWLCSNCATRIDRDPNLYSRELLNTWKEKAEETARQELGNRIPSQQDIINTVSTALTGRPVSFLPEAIRNTCKASAKALENLDPRFVVKTSYQNDVTCFSLFAKEDVDFNFLIKEEFRTEFLEKYENLIAHGESLEIDGSAVKIQGSSLLESILTDTRNGKLVLFPNDKKRAVLKVWLTKKKGIDTFILNDLVGEIVVGKQSFNFKGSAYDGVLEFVCRKELDSHDFSKLVFTMNLNLQKWDGIPINKLPYFEPVYTFYKLLNEGWNINSNLEVDEHVFKGFTPGSDSSTNIQKPYLLFRFIFLAKAVLEYIGSTVHFRKDFKYSRETHEKLHGFYKIISGDNICEFDQIESNASCALIADDNLQNIKYLTKSTEPGAVKFEQDSDPIVLFGESIKLPRRCHILTKVRPRICQDIGRIKPGDKITIEWIPEKGCQYIASFMLD